MFVTGRGRAGFHSQGPAVARAGGDILRVVPAPSLVRGESPLIPWTGPCIAPPIFNGGPAGEWAGQEAGARNPKKRHPAPGRLAGRGGERGRGPAVFGAPEAP